MTPSEIVVAFWEDGWNKHDETALGRYCTEGCIMHFRNHSVRLLSPDGRAILQRWISAFPDVRCTVDDVITQDNRVAVRLTFQGTHKGKFRDWSPTSRPFRFSQMAFARVEEGRIAELWEDYDELGLWQQLGRGLVSASR